jgi:hypothetical protein
VQSTAGMLELIVVIALAGLVVWGITALVPMPPQFAKAIYVVAVILLALYVLRFFRLGGLPPPLALSDHAVSCSFGAT